MTSRLEDLMNAHAGDAQIRELAALAGKPMDPPTPQQFVASLNRSANAFKAQKLSAGGADIVQGVRHVPAPPRKLLGSL